jgi:PAS domain S-box-containing protein
MPRVETGSSSEGDAMSRPEEQTPYLAASRLRALVDHLRIGVLVEDDQRRVAAVNEEFCRLFSLPVSPADLVGADCAEAAEALKHLFVAPDDFLRRIDELLRTRETVEAEEIRLADGRMFERDSIPILDDSVAMGHLWQYRDVTESLERARALQRSNELLRALGKAQQQYIQTADPGAVFNTLLEDLLSLTDSEYGFIGEVLLDRQGRYLKTHAITNIAWNEETRDFYEQNAPTGMVFRNLDTLFGAVMRDGETVIANSPSTDPRRGGLPEGHPDLNAFLGLPFFLGNEMIGMVGIANRPGGYDEALIRELEPFLATCTSVVSAFRTASQLLRSEHRTGAIMDASIDAVVMIDADGLIIEFNPAAERIFGYRRADVIGRSMGEVIVPPALRSTHERGMERYLATGKPRVLDRRLELTGMRADGSEFPVEVSITRLPEVDPPIFVGSLRDITDRVSSQRALELAKEAAEGANRAKSEFLATVSHEIRTPLNVIMGMTEVASEQAATPDQRELLEIVLTNAQSLLQVIDEILDISKIEAGRMEVTPAVTRLVDIIEDVCVSLAPRAHEKGLELLFELSPDLPEAVSVDGLRLRQVIVNLVGNAIKFTAGGWVHVRATAHPGSDGVVPFTLEVTDTGPGIPAGQQDMVFDRFVQLDGTTRREHGGAGLGLSISRSLVELMGGRIRVDSVVGRGSTFVVELELPVVQDPSQDPPEAELAVADLRAAVLTDRPRFADAVGSSLRALQATVLPGCL